MFPSFTGAMQTLFCLRNSGRRSEMIGMASRNVIERCTVLVLGERHQSVVPRSEHQPRA